MRRPKCNTKWRVPATANRYSIRVVWLRTRWLYVREYITISFAFRRSNGYRTLHWTLYRMFSVPGIKYPSVGIRYWRRQPSKSENSSAEQHSRVQILKWTWHLRNLYWPIFTVFLFFSFCFWFLEFTTTTEWVGRKWRLKRACVRFYRTLECCHRIHLSDAPPTESITKHFITDVNCEYTSIE